MRQLDFWLYLLGTGHYEESSCPKVSPGNIYSSKLTIETLGKGAKYVQS